MSEDSLLPFDFPAVQRKKVTAAFDGGRLTSDGGVMLLAAAERRLGIADKLAALIADPRDPDLVTHSVADILRARILAIACGYEDANDLDHLRTDPGFQAGLRAPAGQRRRSVFAADHLALGERADAARGGGHELRHDRPLLRQLCRARRAR